MFKWWDNEILLEIRDILKITQENQRDIIDLREQSLKLQREVMEFQSKLERNAERAHAADRDVARDLQDYTSTHFVSAATHEKDIKSVYEDLNGLEERVKVEFAHKAQLFAVAWSTATALVGCGLYLFEHYSPGVGFH